MQQWNRYLEMKFSWIAKTTNAILPLVNIKDDSSIDVLCDKYPLHTLMGETGDLFFSSLAERAYTVIGEWDADANSRKRMLHALILDFDHKHLTDAHLEFMLDTSPVSLVALAVASFCDDCYYKPYQAAHTYTWTCKPGFCYECGLKLED